ncbi:hypothetical protein EYC84_001837 [Monilinia fructicola]|uniref:Uncharacterized protein n=1 Tax=Monilinia fructicola TaxID=38448 RepID=A0A5M9JYU8_MONFR|nr:hypothetical protein EYC84_001837 [Monilinia fructicola]
MPCCPFSYTRSWLSSSNHITQTSSFLTTHAQAFAFFLSSTHQTPEWNQLPSCIQKQEPLNTNERIGKRERGRKRKRKRKEKGKRKRDREIYREKEGKIERKTKRQKDRKKERSISLHALAYPTLLRTRSHCTATSPIEPRIEGQRTIDLPLLECYWNCNFNSLQFPLTSTFQASAGAQSILLHYLWYPKLSYLVYFPLTFFDPPQLNLQFCVVEFVNNPIIEKTHKIRMNKLSNLGRDMRHWSGPGFGMSRQNQINGMSSMPPHTKPTPTPILAPTPADSTIHYSFNIPFASDLAGPNTEDILYATANAVLRWTHPEDAPDDIPVWKLPVHNSNIEILSKLCADITNGPLPIAADVAVTTPKRPGASPAQVTTVTLSGSPELVHKSRETILNDTPIALRCSVIDVDGDLILDSTKTGLKTSVIEHLDNVAAFCGVDIFLLGPKFASSLTDGLSSNGEAGRDQRWRVAVYGDMESAEHGKTRILIYIDKLLGRIVDGAILELSLHTVICGRSRKNIKMIESATNTAIYFPPPSRKYTNTAPKVPSEGTQRRFLSRVIDQKT